MNSSFVNNSAQIYGGAIVFYNYVIGTFEYVEFEENNVGGKGGAVALINSYLNETDTIYVDNIANDDLLTNDKYIEDEFEYTES